MCHLASGLLVSLSDLGEDELSKVVTLIIRPEKPLIFPEQISDEYFKKTYANHRLQNL